MTYAKIKAGNFLQVLEEVFAEKILLEKAGLKWVINCFIVIEIKRL